MKGLFPEFDPRRDRNFQEIWSNCVFVFDANVLLNIYRYQADTRDQLLSIIEKIKPRIWIPYHVALEFNRNRLRVIASQGSKFSEVRAILLKYHSKLRIELEALNLHRRHSVIEISNVLSEIERVISGFASSLDELEANQPKLTDNDPLKDRIEELFHKHVGDPPKDQTELNQLYDAARKRYEKKIPPGYMDDAKEGDFLHRGLIYQPKFGDYVVWREILAFAEAQKLDSLIFITDDAKEDWWWKETMGGDKILGPRPELIEEARSFGIRDFLMYSPDRFLEYSKELLNASVSTEALADVREVSSNLSELSSVGGSETSVHRIVFNWLNQYFDNVAYSASKAITFSCDFGKLRFGFIVNMVPVLTKNTALARRIIQRGEEMLESSGCDVLQYVWVARSHAGVVDAVSVLRKLQVIGTQKGIYHIVGLIKEGDNGQNTFLAVTQLGSSGDVSFFPSLDFDRSIFQSEFDVEPDSK